MGEIITIASFGPETLTEDLLNEYEWDSSISGVKYSDDDGDGERGADEPGLAGWTINLYRLSEQTPQEPEGPVAAQVPEGWDLVDSTVTGDGGAYSFEGLPPGVYQVEEVMQDGWIQTDAPEGPFELNGEVQVVTDLDFGNTEILPFTDTTIDKSANKTKANPGDVITYTLTYKNIGEETLEEVTIVDDYDERYMTVVDAAGGTVADGTITWVFEDLAPDEERSVSYKLKVDEDMPDGTTFVDNTATIDPFGDSDSWRVTVEEDFLPFTGGEVMLLVLAFLIAIAMGVALRRYGRAHSSSKSPGSALRRVTEGEGAANSGPLLLLARQRRSPGTMRGSAVMTRWRGRGLSAPP